jgi:Family of unknown function (DUF6422)
MTKSPYPENLTAEQSEALEKAALLIITARNEAAAMLARAGVELPGGPSGSPCMAMADVGRPCGCNNYKGDGGTCLTLTTTDPGFPPSRSCGHLASQHVWT